MKRQIIFLFLLAAPIYVYGTSISFTTDEWESLTFSERHDLANRYDIHLDNGQVISSSRNNLVRPSVRTLTFTNEEWEMIPVPERHDLVSHFNIKLDDDKIIYSQIQKNNRPPPKKSGNGFGNFMNSLANQYNNKTGIYSNRHNRQSQSTLNQSTPSYSRNCTATTCGSGQRCVEPTLGSNAAPRCVSYTDNLGWKLNVDEESWTKENQSAGRCNDNRDCPNGTFCDSTYKICLKN